MIFNSNLKLYVFLDTICQNFRKIQQVTNKEVAAVLKANAYGLGVEPIAGALWDAGCEKFFVATVYEGVALRKILGGKPIIFILNCFHESDLGFYKEYNLRPVINSIEQMDIWLAYCVTIPLVLHFDTGMNRQGLSIKEMEAVLPRIRNIPVEYVISHMACAEDVNDPHNEKQLKIFKDIIPYFPAAKHSLTASESLNLSEEYLFHTVRVGKALYGSIPPVAGKATEYLEFAFKTQARILQTRTILKGESIGYGATYTASETRKIATIGIGFADGLPRACSNKGIVYVGEYEAPIIGRVSMDLTIIDVSHIPEKYISTDTWVEVIKDRASFYRQAQDSNSGIYELITRLGGRYERVYAKKPIEAI